MPYEPDDSRAARRARRLRTLWHLCWGAVALLLGVALLLFAGIGLILVPDQMAEERAYQAARPCEAVVTVDCLRSVQATVRDTDIREPSKGGKTYDLLLTGPGVPRKVAMGGAEPLLRHLRAGDVVTVTMWRDYAIAVGKDGVTQDSVEEPGGLSLLATNMALAAFAIGLFAVYAGGHAVARAPRYAATGLPERLGKRLGQTFGAVGCVIPAGVFGMWTGPVGVIVLWLVLVGVLLVATRERDMPGRRVRAAVEESVTAFGEEVAALDLNVNGPDATPAVLKEYRAALAAYDRASAARREPDALTALRDGRAAMIRLDARLHGRPVPIDALPPASGPGRQQPLTGTGERYVYTGRNSGETEVLIDRPEPGRPVLVEADATRGDMEISFEIKTMTRTEDLTKTGDTLVHALYEYHGRRYLPADATHLRVGAWSGRRWSIRVAPLSAATALAPEHRGHGDEVLRYNGGPAVLTVQFEQNEFWKVRYVCQCLRSRSACDCRLPAWPEDTPGDNDWSVEAYDLRDGRNTLRLPRPGFLVIDCFSRSWYLTTQPVDIPPPAPPGLLGRFGPRR
ncbi:hypothetical protein ACIQMV_29345 [Streptomyces sp. NPDC091412]|uniref:hypothetical protein n=1 Tax=Streptomyces sp. NPDC091412 TaxID=3366002 RepID=UPI00380F0A1D